jgi:hypothetical protein
VPIGPGELADAGNGVTGIPPPAGSAEATWLKAGAAEVQPWGTDKAPSEAARAETADTAPPGAPKVLAPPMFSDDLNIGNPLPKVPAVDPNDFTSDPEPSIVTPEVSIDADEVAPEVRACADASAVVDDDVEAVSDDSGDVEVEVDVAADATVCSALGIVAVLSCVTVCAPVPAAVPAAWVTVAPTPAAPDELVVSVGAVKGASAEAADDAPA